MTLVPYKAEHLLAIQLQLGQREVAPFITPEHALLLEDEYAFTFMADGAPVAVGGVTKVWDNRAIVWSFIDRSAGPHFAAIHKAAKFVLGMVPYKRLEADTSCDWPQGRRWLKMLGFHCEAERMVAYRPDGGDSALYAMVR